MKRNEIREAIMFSDLSIVKQSYGRKRSTDGAGSKLDSDSRMELISNQGMDFFMVCSPIFTLWYDLNLNLE